MFFSFDPKVDGKVPFLNIVKFGCVDSGCFNLKDGNKADSYFSIICSFFTAACQG